LPKSLYEKVYCARGQAENLIKAHKLHLASDRTPRTKATANQFRLLADAEPARVGAPDIVLAQGIVRDDPPLPDQGGRAYHRGGHKTRLGDRLPLSGRFHRSRRPHRQITPVSDGAVCPHNNPPAQPQTRITSVPDATENHASAGGIMLPNGTPHE
jgi:hypothetical protein